MRRFATATVMALMSAALPASAAAAIITLNETFTVTGIMPAGAPLSTLTGTFSLTLDDAVDSVDTTGTVLTISVPGLSLAGATPMYAYAVASDILHVGAYSVGNFVTNAGTNYISILIDHPFTTPVLRGAQYSQAGLTSNFFSRVGTVTPVDAPTPVSTVPEPVSLALLSTGLALTALRSRKVSRQRYSR